MILTNDDSRARMIFGFVSAWEELTKEYRERIIIINIY